MEYQLGMWCRFFLKLFSVYGRYRTTMEPGTLVFHYHVLSGAQRFDRVQLRCVYNSNFTTMWALPQ